MAKIILTVMIIVACLKSHAQYISPTDLLQMHKQWQQNDPHADRNTVEYLLTVDKRWLVAVPPKIDVKGYLSILQYAKDSTRWYKPIECEFVLSIERGNPPKKSLAYRFVEVDTWLEYNKQMTLMNAVNLGSGVSDGGHQTIYEVNDIAIILTEYPPGINGVDKCYQVTLLHSTH